MSALIIASAVPGAGKTLIAAALAKHLMSVGRKVAFLKPVQGDAADGDAAFMKKVLGMPEAVEQISPRLDAGRAPEQIKAAAEGLGKGRDIVIIEATVAAPEDPISQAWYKAARSAGARVIAVEAYKQNRAVSFKDFRPGLLGVIVNKAPAAKNQRVRETESARLSGDGLKLLGVLPEDRAALELSVEDIAAIINGTVISGKEKTARTVENIMLGAMSVDSGLLYYRRKPAKAAIIRADRADMQLAALETDTACVVLAGPLVEPIHSVAFKAEYRGVPMIACEDRIADIMEKIDKAVVRSKFDREDKLPALGRVLQQNIDVTSICGALGAGG